MSETYGPELIKGTSETIVLAVLAREPLHGYGIIKHIRAVSGERFRMNEGALYPLLHRLEREGKLRSTEVAQGARTRKQYAVTPVGREALEARSTEWRDYVGFMRTVIEGETQ